MPVNNKLPLSYYRVQHRRICVELRSPNIYGYAGAHTGRPVSWCIL